MSRGFKLLLGIVLICVVALFFFPLASGSFQSTHGPTTALDSGGITLDIALILFVLVLPSISLSSAPCCHLDTPTDEVSASHPLRTLLCTFRC